MNHSGQHDSQPVVEFDNYLNITSVSFGGVSLSGYKTLYLKGNHVESLNKSISRALVVRQKYPLLLQASMAHEVLAGLDDYRIGYRTFAIKPFIDGTYTAEVQEIQIDRAEGINSQGLLYNMLDQALVLVQNVSSVLEFKISKQVWEKAHASGYIDKLSTFQQARGIKVDIAKQELVYRKPEYSEYKLRELQKYHKDRQERQRLEHSPRKLFSLK